MKGIDIGTNSIVAAIVNVDGNPIFKQQRDCFYRIIPKTPINAKNIGVSLNKRGASHIIDTDGSFIVIGQDALEIAIERNDTVQRPMQKGIISPKEKAALPMLKLIIESLLGKANDNEKLIYSVPAKPVDSNFDITYHSEMLKFYLNQLGYDSSPINEAYAVAISELLDDGLTGIAISCLVPGTKIYTDRGILDIEEVKEGDSVITHKNRLKKISKIISKKFSGMCTKIQIQGYTNDTESYKFVDNHELYVFRNNNWAWVGCDDIKIGDIIGEPILKQNFDLSEPSITICERSTSSNNYTKKHIRVSTNVQRLIGYFLGDGSICERDSGIQFDFHKDEVDNINDVINILKNSFNKNSHIVDHGNNCKRVKCYSKGMASWFRKNCYDLLKNKKYPWTIERISNSCCLNLLAGLIRSDGKIDKNSVVFFNTSTNLAILVKQLFSRLNIAASITYRLPRLSKIDGRVIKGVKNEWIVGTGKKTALISISDLIKNIDCSNSTFVDKLFINDNFCCSTIQNIEYEHYDGMVYDLQVEDDHSFSGPFLTIHNCGAGMTNICIVHEGDSLIEFSMAKGGDFIDQSVSDALDIPASLVQMEKEDGTDLYNPTSKVMEAVVVYYNTVINYVVQNITFELKRREKELPKFSKPIPIVVSGGLTLADGFVKRFNEIINNSNFPVKISNIIKASDPMKAVAAGALLATNL